VYEIITIPFDFVSKTFNVDDLNSFCINKKVISTKIEFFQDEKSAYWTVFIEYEPVLEKKSNEPTDLTEAGRLCYEKLRQWRKETAEKEGIPAYVIAKNSHLGEIVKKEIKTLESLKQLNGFGTKKIEKYGKDICGIVKAFYSDISDEK
jgi:superfamily II DNA helicase RecQ